MQRHYSAGSSWRRATSLSGWRVGKEHHGLGLFSLGTRSDWARHAACRGEDPEMFFPESPRRGATRAEHREHPRKIAAAKEFCVTRCPVLELCLAAAVRNGERLGVFAGYDFSSKAERDEAEERLARESLQAC